MDKLTRFNTSGEVGITSEGGNSIDTVISGLEDILRELRLTRLGHEEMTWGETVEDNPDIDLGDISPDIEEELA